MVEGLSGKNTDKEGTMREDASTFRRFHCMIFLSLPRGDYDNNTFNELPASFMKVTFKICPISILLLILVTQIVNRGSKLSGDISNELPALLHV